MANVKKGNLTPAGEWWKHLRWAKHVFCKGERQAGRKEAVRQGIEAALEPIQLSYRA